MDEGLAEKTISFEAIMIFKQYSSPPFLSILPVTYWITIKLHHFSHFINLYHGILQADCLPFVDSPSPRVHNYNNYKTELTYSGSLPAEGFSMKYDPSDEYIAIGCYNGTKTLLTAKDSNSSMTQRRRYRL